MRELWARRSLPRFRLLALLATLVLTLGLSMVGVAYAKGGPERNGDHGYTASSEDREQVDRDTSDDRGSADRTDSDSDSGSRDSSSRDSGSRDSRSGTPKAKPTDRLDADSPASDSSDDPNAPDPNDPNAPEPLDPSIKLAPPDPPGSLVEGTPCTKAAVACVSLGQNKSWLFKKDATTGETVIDHGPVDIRSGGPGKETPLGDFKVEWKDKNHKSGEYFRPQGCKPPEPGCEGAPMNWSVFFAEGGIAFHEGTLEIRSSGCVRLSAKDAEFYYTALQIGDRVEIRN